MKFRNFGQKSLSEIEQVLNERGLHFGMDLESWVSTGTIIKKT
jgi:DNA-directed RNA polymerase alpha subunit